MSITRGDAKNILKIIRLAQTKTDDEVIAELFGTESSQPTIADQYMKPQDQPAP